MSQGVGLIDFQSEYNEIDKSIRRSPLTVLSSFFFKRIIRTVTLKENFELNRAWAKHGFLFCQAFIFNLDK
jgi:hypothetical protein